MMKRLFLKGLITGLLIQNPGMLSAQNVIIDFATEFQTITGFGGMNNPGWIPDLNADQREKAFGNEPGQLGLSIMRMRISPNSASFGSELNTAKYAYNHGVLLLASPWSPPAGLKTNNNLVLGHLLPENYGAYTDHLLSFATFMENNGAPLTAISMQNEPDWSGATYESCDWTAEEMRAYVESQGSRFGSLKLVASESLNFNHSMTDPILNDPDAEPHVDIIGGHLYGGGLKDYPLAREKGKEVWMTEHLNGSDSPSQNTWGLAMETASEISSCMKANFNAYIWWYIRRFYSFINDAGNITAKGYMFSHFSKFIRPGFIRIDAQVDSDPMIDVTAYKTDSSFVIVVINKNREDKELSCVIQNGSIDSLTQFTTSATKRMQNDGGIKLTGGTFTASIDAYSITTFASYTGNAGKFGNIEPVAFAGSDTILLDENADGTGTIILDASGSYDADGSIENFSWAMDGEQISWSNTLTLTLPVGNHAVFLTVTDNDGAVNRDTINIRVTSLYNTEIWMEAECGIVGDTWEILGDAFASDEEYVTCPAGIENPDSPSTDSADLVIFPFHLSESGNYRIWGRVISPSADDDSYWVNIDNGTEWILWNGIPGGSSWHWDDIHDQNNDNPVVFELDTGYHTLKICYREDGTLLDKVLIANTGLLPSGAGEDAGNCPADTLVAGNTTEIWIEAECGEKGSTWEVHADTAASNERFIHGPEGTDFLFFASGEPSDQVVYQFYAPESSIYRVWGRLINPTTDDDSFWVKMDSNPEWIYWRYIPLGNDWHWDDVHDQNNDNPVEFNLKEGNHKLTICIGEDGALLDRILIENTGIIPSGKGGNGESCLVDTTGTGLNPGEILQVTIYPNPARDEFRVKWDHSFRKLFIYGIDGSCLYRKEYPPAVFNDLISVDIKPGIYILRLENETLNGIGRLIVE